MKRRVLADNNVKGGEHGRRATDGLPCSRNGFGAERGGVVRADASGAPLVAAVDAVLSRPLRDFFRAGVGLRVDGQGHVDRDGRARCGERGARSEGQVVVPFVRSVPAAGHGQWWPELARSPVGRARRRERAGVIACLCAARRGRTSPGGAREDSLMVVGAVCC